MHIFQKEGVAMTEYYPLTKEEKETVVLYNQSVGRIIISGYDPRLFRKLTIFAEKYPDFCERIDSHKYSDFYEFSLEKRCLSLRLIQPMSEEQKTAARERAKAIGLGGAWI